MSRRPLRTELGAAAPDRILVRGHDLADLIGRVSLGAFAFLELAGRLPSPDEAAVFDAIVVPLVEHGLTPSALATRLTLLGAPESLQGAVAAGLLGMGDRYGGPVEAAARRLQEGVARGGDQRQTARRIVADHVVARRPVLDLGHPVHRRGDPRVLRLFQVAAEHGFAVRTWS